VSSGESDAHADDDAVLALEESSDDARETAQSERAERAGGPVLIELSRSQVNQVVREASDRGNMTTLLSGLDGVRQAVGAASEQLENPRLSRSLLSGLLVLAVFPTDGSSVPVTEAARLLDMSASTTHRYFKTLLAVGLLEQDSRTREYRLCAMKHSNAYAGPPR